MTSAEPDEDADSLDDEKLLEEFLANPPSVIEPTAASAPQDWPYRPGVRETLAVDADILAWFRANHENWQRQIGSVLRAWIATRPQTGF